MNRRGRPPHPDILTPREWEVLAFLRQGHSNEQIAERLGITLRTAKFHVSEILSKLAVESREQAAAWQPEEAPAPARRWLAWPLIARIAGALVVAAAVAALGLLAWGVLRTGGVPDEPADVRARALEAMAALDSYHVEIQLEADPSNVYTGDISGSDFSATVPLTRARSGSSTSSGISTTPDPSEPSGPGRAEQIVLGEAQYLRWCSNAGACDPWRQFHRSLATVGDPPHPRHGLAALEDGYDLVEVTNGKEVDGAHLHLRGKVNATRSMLRVIFPYSYLSPDRREQYERAAELEDVNPSTVDVWMSSVDLRVRQITITRYDGDGSPRTTEYRFSHFNEVTITPPTDFIPMTTPTPTP